MNRYQESMIEIVNLGINALRLQVAQCDRSKTASLFRIAEECRQAMIDELEGLEAPVARVIEKKVKPIVADVNNGEDMKKNVEVKPVAKKVVKKAVKKVAAKSAVKAKKTVKKAE